MPALNGLSENEVLLLQRQWGRNSFSAEPRHRLLHLLLDLVREPMFLMLVAACLLYFLLGQTSEGFLMIAAICMVTAISFYQEVKSSKALHALKQLTQPKVTVIRSGRKMVVPAEELVPGDLMLLEEGDRVPADAEVLQANDLSVDESIVTGESLPVEKRSTQPLNVLYQGTTINSGKCYATVTATGSHTVLGKLGRAITFYASSKTLLQQQIGQLVRRLAIFGFLAFLLIFAGNYLHSQNLVSSLLFGLTLAMAAIPEEIPVAFSSFMALGAYHLSRRGIITRQPQTIENLGAVTVVCLDKTGTITENRMQVASIYDAHSDQLVSLQQGGQKADSRLLLYAVLASEREPFDAMEKAIWQTFYEQGGTLEAGWKMIHEYPLQGVPPMMTHVYQTPDGVRAVAKGGVEHILQVCRPGEQAKIEQLVQELTGKGFRVLGIASAVHEGRDFPAQQDGFHWRFEGLLSLYDPPRKNTARVLQQFYNAGIAVKLLTGDHAQTALYIANQVGLKSGAQVLTGAEVLRMNAADVQQAVKNVSVFARMFPDAKLKVIEALKTNGEIVAMSGDGVNDGPAIKAAHIGIAMGQRGTEIARQAADLVLTDDNLEKITEAIAQGRKIFSNLKKAVRYIISIHIPIILTASLPLLFGWTYPNIFTPVHIIFLELIMGPTCSVFFEREPVERTSMQMPPRDRSKGLFQRSEALMSVVQGLVLAGGVLLLYAVFMQTASLERTRTLVFTTLLVGNIFLTFANRSFTETIVHTIRYPNTLALPVLLSSVGFLGAVLLIPPVRDLFGLVPLRGSEVLLCAGAAFLCVAWFEVYKAVAVQRKKKSGGEEKRHLLHA